MNHWLGAGANLIVSGDLIQIDNVGHKPTTSEQSIAAADFFALYLMQPCNTGTADNLAQQLQAWIRGPSDEAAYVLVANYGPDGGAGGFGTQLPGIHSVTVSLADLGIPGTTWVFTDIWEANSKLVSDSYTAWLTEGGSQLLRLTPSK